MKSPLFFILITVSVAFSGCFTSENASDVNQEKISTFYQTEFFATRDYTKSLISFKFGTTPLKISNATYYRDFQLSQNSDIILGLHYAKEVDGIKDGSYEWTDEDGKTYTNNVKVFSFDLSNPIQEIEKYKYYNLSWNGDDIPNGSADFYITITSHESSMMTTFYAGESLEIESDKLDDLPIGLANMKISRNHSETIDEKTQAGGKSSVSFIREYEITITE